MFRHQGTVVIAGIQGAASAPIESRVSAAHAQCGITLETDVRQVLSSEPLFARLSGQIGDLLGRGISLSLRLSQLGTRDSALQFEHFCHRLSAALDAPGAHTTTLGISLPAGRLRPDVAWQIRKEALGTGPLNIICDDSCDADDSFWLRLWHLRREQHVTVALWPLLRGPSPLLPTEPAGNVEPIIGLQVPSGSAWLSQSLQLSKIIAADATLDEDKMMSVLSGAVRNLDAAHESAEWQTPAMYQDACLNRRLAVHIEGIGDTVDMLRLDPARRETRATMLRILQQIRDGLKTVTQGLAHESGLLPAIEISNPLRGIAAGPIRDRWELRWQRALARGAVRHRNLLALSPWSLFPRRGADQRYCGLVTLLGQADACVFRGRPSLENWNSKDFKHFYQNLWAVRRQVAADALVAERL